MENLLKDHNNTNETPTVVDDAKKQEASECLLILLSLALSCMRKLTVRIYPILGRRLDVFLSFIAFTFWTGRFGTFASDDSIS